MIRGNTAGHKFGIDTTYLLRFDRIIVSGGGFQYQQLVAGDQWPVNLHTGPTTEECVVLSGHPPETVILSLHLLLTAAGRFDSLPHR